MSIFSKLREGLAKTRQGFMAGVSSLLKGRKVNDELFEELEELLISGDVGIATTQIVLQKISSIAKERRISEAEELRILLKEILAGILSDLEPTLSYSAGRMNIFLIVGVNGVGKTTTIGKLAMRYREQGKKVMVAAGDTFRAGAARQLEVWAQRAGAYFVSHKEGADPAAVVFDAIHSARAKEIDLLLIDTAGRLHNKSNLMQELGKINRIIEREAPQAMSEILLVVDATTGQNAIQQAQEFLKIVPVSGIILTKLDGTARGGIVIAIGRELRIPVKLIGVGEKIDDLRDFNHQEFLDAIFDEGN
ncbi:MAG: signal recognition particle-docking protein FtsY [bacterium]|nr:signal recognition particle-docking protein FtsY [bacterium]